MQNKVELENFLKQKDPESNPINQFEKFIEKRFENLIKEITNEFKKTDKKNISNIIPELGRLLKANLYSLATLIRRQEDVENIALIHFEMFLNAFNEDSDAEFSLEDCIETIKNLNIREEKTIISVECNSCLVKKSRNQVF
jgi:hypothetical protein